MFNYNAHFCTFLNFLHIFFLFFEGRKLHFRANVFSNQIIQEMKVFDQVSVKHAMKIGTNCTEEEDLYVCIV